MRRRFFTDMTKPSGRHDQTLRQWGITLLLVEQNANRALRSQVGPWDTGACRCGRIKVVPLTYARADELAYTLSMVAPPWVRIVPYYAGNSLIISGPAAAVEELLDIIR